MKSKEIISFRSGNFVRQLFDHRDFENWASNDNKTITDISPLSDPSILNIDYDEYSKANLNREKKIIKSST